MLCPRKRLFLCKLNLVFKTMKGLTEIEIAGIKAVKKLRRSKLNGGEFFMINLNSLPDDHCYLEFPDGTIRLAIYKSGAKDFTIVRELESDESSELRKKFDLEPIR